MRSPTSSARADEVLLLEHVEHGERGGLGDRVADVRPADRAVVGAVHDRRPPDHAREWKAGGDRLRDRHQVRLDAQVLHREHAAGTAEAGLHLVGDEDDAVAVADRPQPLHVRARRGDEPTLAELWLDHDGSHVLRRDVRLEDPLEPLQRLGRARPAVLVRVRRPVDLRRERAHPGLVRMELRRHRHRQERPPVERPLERDHAGPPGVQARELDRVLDRLRAGVEERGARLARDRRERAQALGQLDRGLVRDDREVGVEEAGGLLDDRLDDAGMAVTDVHHTDAHRRSRRRCCRRRR